MGRTGSGVEVRERSIRIAFLYEGETRRETLRTNGEPMPPTPANVRYANRLAAEIKDKIRHGTFNPADYFPASRWATTGQGTTVADQLDLWLKLQTGRESSTLKGYRVAVAWWKAQVGGKPLRGLKHSDILAAFAARPDWSGKTVNNKASVLRQALQLALRDGLITSSPMAGLEPAEHQAPEPDPFSLEEAEVILDDLRRHYDQQVVNYFELKFFTGMRTSESLAVRWDAIDWRLRQMTVREAIVLGEHKTRTKTNSIRHVQLNSRAVETLTRQKAHTFLAGGLVFQDPRTGRGWLSDEGPRENFWRPALRRTGIRYRSPYETRHTYATAMLMAGMTPAFCARQLGHSVEQFLRTYSKWIDGGRDQAEMAKLESFMGADSSLQSPWRSGT